MAKKNSEETQPTKVFSSPEETAPVKPRTRKTKSIESQAENTSTDAVKAEEPTQPVKSTRRKAKEAVYVDPTPEPVSTEPVKKARAPRKTVLEPTVVEPLEVATAEEDKPERKKRVKWVWLGILMLIVLMLAGAGIGYASAMKVRHAEEENQNLTAAVYQFELAAKDQQAGRLDMARQRLEYIISIYPDYPGISEKLAEVLLAQGLAQTAPQSTEPTTQAITPVATKDTRQTSVLLKQAQDQLNASDWEGLFKTVMNIRDIDPTYEPITVDGLFYYALRYNGILKIQQGSLEVGLYYLAMAEEMAPLDANAFSGYTSTESYRSWAKMYVDAATYYGIDWYTAADRFYTLMGIVPHFVDASGITAKQRYYETLEGIGDVLQMEYKYCEAVTQYEAAAAVLTEQEFLDKLVLAREYCANPPATPTPTLDPNAPTATPEVVQ